MVFFVCISSPIYIQFYWWKKPPTCHKSLTNIITATTAPDILRLPDTKGHVRYDQHFM